MTELRVLVWSGKKLEHLRRKTAVTAAITAILYLILFYFVDKSVVLWVHHNISGTWVHAVGKYISYLAQGSPVRLGLAFCFILILVCDSGLKRHEAKLLLYVCLCAAIAITIGDGLKYLLARYRPIMLFEHNLYGLHFFSRDWVMHSTPSGHTIRAFVIMTALSMLFRRYAVVFISLAVLIGLSRVIMTDHYPSDVLFGAYIGIFTALWTYVHYFPEEKDSNESNETT